MIDEKLYNTLIRLLCERYDYHTYAADISDNELKNLLSEAVKSQPSLPVIERQESLKAALIDFFEALYQRVFIFEENDQLRLIKHYDANVLTEREDRSIHFFRQQLLDHCSGIKEALANQFLFEFSKDFRHSCEEALATFDAPIRRQIIRDQFRQLFELDTKDMIAFLDKKLFIRRFDFPMEKRHKESLDSDFFVGKTFIESFWNDVAQTLEKSFEENFIFYDYKLSFFKEKASEHFLRIIDRVISNSIDIKGESKRLLASAALKQFWPHFFEVCALELLEKVDLGHRKAVQFTKLLLESKNAIFDYGVLHQEVKCFTKLSRQVDKKVIECQQAKSRCKKLENLLLDVEDDVKGLDFKRRTLMDAITKAEEQLEKIEQGANRVEYDRLLMTKRDLLESFKQIEAGRKKYTNIATNRRIELSSWLDRKRHKEEELMHLDSAMKPVINAYEKVCKEVASLLQEKD